MLPTPLMLIIFVFYLDKSLKEGKKRVCNGAIGQQSPGRQHHQKTKSNEFTVVIYSLLIFPPTVLKENGSLIILRLFLCCTNCQVLNSGRDDGSRVTRHYFSQKITLKLWKSHSVPLSKMWLRETGEILICRKIVVSALWQKHSIQDGEACYSSLETCGGWYVITLSGKKVWGHHRSRTFSWFCPFNSNEGKS